MVQPYLKMNTVTAVLEEIAAVQKNQVLQILKFTQ
jgi:hypothetical protein